MGTLMMKILPHKQATYIVCNHQIYNVHQKKYAALGLARRGASHHVTPQRPKTDWSLNPPRARVHVIIIFLYCLFDGDNNNHDRSTRFTYWCEVPGLPLAADTQRCLHAIGSPRIASSWMLRLCYLPLMAHLVIKATHQRGMISIHFCQ